jgi:hypothetical protein
MLVWFITGCFFWFCSCLLLRGGRRIQEATIACPFRPGERSTNPRQGHKIGKARRGRQNPVSHNWRELGWREGVVG